MSFFLVFRIQTLAEIRRSHTYMTARIRWIWSKLSTKKYYMIKYLFIYFLRLFLFIYEDAIVSLEKLHQKFTMNNVYQNLTTSMFFHTKIARFITLHGLMVLLKLSEIKYFYNLYQGMQLYTGCLKHNLRSRIQYILSKM